MLNELAKEIHENAKAHGWWEENRTFPEEERVIPVVGKEAT